MAQILIIHEDRLRGRYRKLLEREGRTVSEISAPEDRAYLPQHMVFHTIMTDLEPLLEDNSLSPFPAHTELCHADHLDHR